MQKAAIIGVSGYAGGELARLLAFHPDVELSFVSSESNAGKPLSSAFPGLLRTPAGGLICQHADMAEVATAADVVFLAQESGAAMKMAPLLLEAGNKVVDLSADFRMKDPTAYPEWYKMAHTAPQLLSTAVYGLPELFPAQLQSASLVANPGCHVTAATLALAPLLTEKIVDTKGIVVDSKTGISGAGRAKTDLLYRFSEANESVKPYGVGGIHRHTPEIEQTLSLMASTPVRITFTPHLVPMTRGLLATCYARLVDETTTLETIHAAFHRAYENSPFVVVRDTDDYPSTKDVYGSNFCHIAVAVDKRTGTVIVTSVIDNLVKGAAGQAVQNMNVMLGLSETAGLEGGGLWP